MKIWQQFKNLSKTVKRITYTLLAIGVYALIGFLLLPMIVQPMLSDELSVQLYRKTSIASVEINPFALSVTINQLAIEGKHTGQLFGFEKLIVNYQILALFKKTIAFDEISIVRPNLNLILLESGEYNFDDIVNAMSSNASDENETSSKKNTQEAWPLAIDKFRYVEGSVYFEDKNRATTFKSKVESLSVSLDDFSTRPGEGNLHRIKAQTLRGTTIDWKGEFSLSPLKSKGSIELQGDLMVVSEYLQEQMRVKINNGNLNLKTDYDFVLAENNSKFDITNMMASINELDVRRKNDANLLSWKKLNLDVSGLDLINKKITINNVSTDGVLLEVEKAQNTDIDFGDLFVLKNMSKESEKTTDNDSPQWDISIAKIFNENLNVILNDKSVVPAAKHGLNFSVIEINNLKPFTDEVANFMLALTVNNKGTLDIKGGVQPKSKLIDLQLQASSIALKEYQSYLNDVLRVKVLSGDFNAKLKLNIDASKDIPAIKIVGGMNVSSLAMRDKELKEKFISWKKLSFDKVSFELPQQKINISEIKIDQPYLRLVMNGGGETNIQKLFIEKQTNNKQSTNEESALQAEIKNIRINNAKMDFSDNSLSPSFSAGIYSLKGNISGLSSKQLSKARIDLKGKVDKYAPVTIKGDINPLTKDKYTEIEMLFKGIELTTFTPYSGKFAGYKIEKGKLSLDLKYKLSKNELVAENGVILDQLTLGEETNSEDATSLPVNFALSLLKDANGVIDFNLPIRGNIDDPDFHYGSLVWGALGNLIVGIVSSPFKALANLAGGDSAGLDYIVFSANSAELMAEQKSKLDALAKALIQRPELHLEIRGVSSSLIDHDEMAYLKVRKQLKLKPMALSVIVTEDDRDELIDYYETITKLSANDLLPKKHQLTSKQAEQMVFDKALIVVLNNAQVTEQEYELLAKQRADKIQQYLIDVGKVPAKNIFLLDNNIHLENKFEDVENASLQLPLGLKAK